MSRQRCTVTVCCTLLVELGGSHQHHSQCCDSGQTQDIRTNNDIFCNCLQGVVLCCDAVKPSEAVKSGVTAQDRGSVLTQDDAGSAGQQSSVTV